MKLHPETLAIRQQTSRTEFQEHSVPLYLSSSFVFDDAEQMRAAFAEEIPHHIYSRYSNPNVAEFTQKIVHMEGAEAGYSFASGMAAIYASFQALLKPGDHILSCRSVFGSTHYLFQTHFPKWQVETTYFDATETDLESFVRPSTKILYVETPTNPATDILDLEKLGAFAKAHNLLFVVDNCFATPVLQQPIQYGADLVVHSATKLIDGQGRVLGGIVVGRKELIREIYLFSRNTGPSLSPFNAWVLSKSLETLHLRVERHCKNALEIAQQLEARPEISFVRYPFLPSHPGYQTAIRQMKAGGNIVAFELAGGLEKGRKFLDALDLLSRSPNLGDTRSIVTHPASTTHSKLSEEDRLAVGITPGLVRCSIGLENPEDILQDLIQALEASR